jgi:hypothetical protein
MPRCYIPDVQGDTDKTENFVIFNSNTLMSKYYSFEALDFKVIYLSHQPFF